MDWDFIEMVIDNYELWDFIDGFDQIDIVMEAIKCLVC